jgi:superkiller protein 3
LDELRRTTESKLLCWKERRLHSVPPSLKLPLSQQLDEMVDGIVLLNTPDELGWKIFFEGRDCEDMCKLPLFCTLQLLIFCLLAGYDKAHVRDYIKLFPDSTLAFLFKGYFTCMNTLIADDDEEHSLFVPTDVDPVDTLLV